MRLIKHLKEGRTQEITEDEFSRLIDTSYKDSWLRLYDKSCRIYRGIELFKIKIGMVKPSEFERASANTGNTYTILIDNLPSWSEYPKRSKSIVCSTSISRSALYGVSGDRDQVFLVFPENGSKIGVCPQYDIWNSFSSFGSMHSFNGYMEDLFDSYKKFSGKKTRYNETWSSFKRITSEIDKVKRDFYKEMNYKMRGTIIDLHLVEYFEGRDDRNLIDIIEDFLNPKNNHFKIAKAGDSLPKEREVWTDGNCLLIKYWYAKQKYMVE